MFFDYNNINLDAQQSLLKQYAIFQNNVLIN